jgi:hypothetical protein
MTYKYNLINCKGSGRKQQWSVWGIIAIFSWRNWEKPGTTSVSLVGAHVEIRTSHFRNTKLDALELEPSRCARNHTRTSVLQIWGYLPSGVSSKSNFNSRSTTRSLNQERLWGGKALLGLHSGVRPSRLNLGCANSCSAWGFALFSCAFWGVLSNWARFPSTFLPTLYSR